MKISGKFILKVAGTLTVISLIVAALLGLVNNVTADKIAEIDAEKTRVSMSAVVPEGSEFTDKLEISDDVAAAAAADIVGGAADLVVHRLPGSVQLEVMDKDFYNVIQCFGQAEPPGNVRRDDHIRFAPQRVV